MCISFFYRIKLHDKLTRGLREQINGGLGILKLNVGSKGQSTSPDKPMTYMYNTIVGCGQEFGNQGYIEDPWRMPET
jgi:hypothetical protein